MGGGIKLATVSWNEIHLTLVGVCRTEGFHVVFEFSALSSSWLS